MTRDLFAHVPARDVQYDTSVVVPVLTPGIAGMTLAAAGSWCAVVTSTTIDLIAHEFVHVRQWRELGAVLSSRATSARTCGAGGGG